jgi:hypothetical protein
MMRFAGLLPVTFLLAACGPFGDPIGDICFSCVGSVGNAPLAATDTMRVRLIHGGTLPASATNVYYTEQCGIDCIQWVRFDIPEGEWAPLRARLSADARPDNPSEAMAPPGNPDWWRIEPEGAAERLRFNGPQGWPLNITAYGVDTAKMRVFLVALQM